MRTVARSVSDRGELTLAQRPDGTLELRVNGLFAMDSAETTSERLLASAAIGAATSRGGEAAGLRVLVGGLGLGFTVAALLEDPRVDAVVVAEIEPDLVQWHRAGVVPQPVGERLLGNPRVQVVVADVRDYVVSQDAGIYDLVLLDVDNGPGFLLYDANAAIYREPFLSACARLLRPGGVTAIWSSSESAPLSDAMAAAYVTTDAEAVPVQLDGRHTEYHLYLGRTEPEGTRRAG